MKLQPGRKGSAASDNNLIPMINVVFLLLIFFMVAGNIRVSDPLPLLAPTSTQDKPSTAQTVLYVAGDGTLMFEQQLITLENLGSYLKTLSSVNEPTIVSPDKTTPLPSDTTLNISSSEAQLAIKADAQVPVALLRNIMNIVRDAGISQVELLTTRIPVDAP
ncbi:ExbD/TolR family protein [Granulosicoccus antarcticus]|uniref:Biopolymer transport protein ExbD n=1 Tax=Granulosicoccus antarcticus IMCC3135 TaxID=1192854 RepID=A0A2Z2P5U7_9GAMM|nr:biopolymer transporter ExbD [Granulosicoccus antarcticus]ASJ75204.1 hypothetical protein IMCC3135_25745 [Granulosicoccus antarcticus IMCC3135]